MHNLRLKALILAPVILATLPAQAQTPIELRRSAAWHDTIVTMLGNTGLAGATTYVKDRFTYTESYPLGLFLPSVERDGKLTPCLQARNAAIEDFPGGVRTRFELDGFKITAEIMPLVVGRDTPEQDGAVLYSLRSDPPATLVLDLGDASVDSPLPQTMPADGDLMPPSTGAITNEAGVALIKAPGRPLISATVTPPNATTRKNARGGEYLRLTFKEGSGTALLGYAAKPERAGQLARLDPAAARRQVEDYYARLLQCRVETPVKNINDAFRGALITLEYNWIEPIGWNESIQFWHALWHMQHTAGAEWIGQQDRSRQCNVTHAENLMPDGAVPQMMQYVHKRRDFGGSNQFFCWQVRHYWNFTADKPFAEKLAPVLDRVIEQSFAENDADRDGLLGWGLQIGNQEDYIATPDDGATPSIEGINMYRARRELALGLGDVETAERCEGEIRRITGRLRDQLWQADLGRFIFWRDPLGAPHLDGQYHTLLYPVIWDLAGTVPPVPSPAEKPYPSEPASGELPKEAHGPPAAWSMLRHLRDRLMDDTGAIYCSNNFPNHVVATVGTQAGLAQQPWAAWGLAKAGMRNETWRPLAAAANWVMDANHRGVWPEISVEPNPAHFSPPAGLFVAATVEALFGLQVHKPEGALVVSPNFPDDWNDASLNLPDYQAKFHRNGTVMEYTVRSRDELARHVRWSLPPCRIRDVQVNGRSAAYEQEPGVNCVFLVLRTEPLRESLIRIDTEPADVKLVAPRSVAEGDPVRIDVQGLSVERVDDPSGVLNQIRMEGSGWVTAQVREGLLGPYQGYGRLGQLTFSRRSVFLFCQRSGGQQMWLPIDLTILPRYEAAPAGPVSLAGETINVPLLVRNNTAQQLAGKAWLEFAGRKTAVDINISPRAQKEVTVSIPANLAAMLSPGDNQAALILPSNASLDVTLDASQLIASQEILSKRARKRWQQIPLPEKDLIADTDWTTLRPYKAYAHMPWAGSRPPLEALGDKSEITVPGLEGLPFKVTPRRFFPISLRSGRPSWSLPLNGRTYKKLYVLAIPFLDSHDMFAPVAEVAVQAENDGALRRTLHLPGDLDWWSSPATVGAFATAHKDRPHRLGLLPLLKPDQADWPEGRPPAFPQPEFWATCRVVRLNSSVLNLIELDLGRATPLRSLTLSTIGAQPGLGIVSIVGETAGGEDLLRGTPFELPPDLREPRPLFRFNQPGDAEGWKLEGEAFSVSAHPGLFGSPTLNSLAKAGEGAVGKAISPEFTADNLLLSFELQGGYSQAEAGPGLLCIRLIDAKTGETLDTMKPPGTHMLQRAVFSLDRWQGRSLRLEVIDQNTNPSYAWIGIRDVQLLAR